MNVPWFHNLYVFKEPSMYYHVIFGDSFVSSFLNPFKGGTYNNKINDRARSVWAN